MNSMSHSVISLTLLLNALICVFTTNFCRLHITNKRVYFFIFSMIDLIFYNNYAIIDLIIISRHFSLTLKQITIQRNVTVTEKHNYMLY